MLKSILIFATLISLNFNINASDKSTDVFISDISPWMDGQQCENGIICEYFNKLLMNTSINSTYVYTSLSRANEKFYNGEQFISLFPYNKQFSSKYHLLGEVFTYNVGLLSIDKDVQFSPDGEDAICITRNNPHKVEDYSYIEVNAYDQCFEMLNRGRVDFVLITNIEFGHHETTYAKGAKFSFQQLYSVPLWLYLNSSFTEESDTYQQIKNSFNQIKDESKQIQESY